MGSLRPSNEDFVNLINSGLFSELTGSELIYLAAPASVALRL